MRDFLAAIQNNPALFTTIVTPSGRRNVGFIQVKRQS